MKPIANEHERLAREKYLAQPLDRLPSVVREAKTRLNKVESAQRNAEERLEKSIEVNTQHRQLEAELAQAKAELALGQFQLTNGKSTIQAVELELRKWPRLIGDQRNTFLELLNTLARTREFVAYLPGWIQEQAAHVNDAERRLAEFERVNNLVTTGN
jgi:chromosome segregation ATPase